MAESNEGMVFEVEVRNRKPSTRSSNEEIVLRNSTQEEKVVEQLLYRRSVIEEYTPPILPEKGKDKNLFFPADSSPRGRSRDYDFPKPYSPSHSPIEETGWRFQPTTKTDLPLPLPGQNSAFNRSENKDGNSSDEILPPPPQFLVESSDQEIDSLPPPPDEFRGSSPDTNSVTSDIPGSSENLNTPDMLEGKNTKPSPLVSPHPVRRRSPGNVQGKVNELTAEGKHAIDSPGSPTLPDLPPQDYILDEYEERSMIEPGSYDDPKLKELISVLIDWINDELAGHRIIVKDIEEDLYDGQILQKLLEKLTEVKLDVVEVTQSEEGQKQKLKRVLDAANKVLGPNCWNQQKWNVDSIHSKNVVAILHLLVALARHFRAPIRLPENVVINVVVVQKRDGMLHTRTVAEELTSTYDDLGMRVERDAFDTLFDHAPDKLQVVKKSLVTFVNKHLNKINLEVTDLDTQFHDGVYLTLLMGLLEGYFVPLFSFNLTPTTFDQKVHNVAFAFEMMMDSGLQKPKARPEDLVNLDLKSTLRVLYNLFTKYKHLS